MERKSTFNEVASEYDKYRPDYPGELFDDILAYSKLQPDDRIVEVGCGTGQATKGFVERGFDRLTCVELGENMAKLAREKLNGSRVSVVNSSFESWQEDGGRYDLAISGTAFHFIQPQSFGYRKLFGLLRSRGTIALFWTVHIPSFDSLGSRIRECYRAFAPQLDDSRNPALEEIIAERTLLTVGDGYFEHLKVKPYRWNDTYSADDYIALLNTNSRHRMLDEATRARLFSEVKEAIASYGGTINKPQAVILFLATKST